MNSIADRMKQNYELRSRYLLTRRVPVIVRVDGRAFHSYTRSYDKPFDRDLHNSMVRAAEAVYQDMQGCKAAYVQSDEVSFLVTDYDTHETEAWFGYVKSKVESISASQMTAHFNHYAGMCMKTWQLACFDSRAFNVPREEVVNYFLWRMLDWERNSVAMYCQSLFSHKQMHGKGKAAQHDMLHAIGKNWAADVEECFRNGTWIVNGGRIVNLQPRYSEVDMLLGEHIYCDQEKSP